MVEMTYVECKDLMVVTINTHAEIDEEKKEEFKADIRETTGIQNVLIFSGCFTHIPTDKNQEDENDA